MINTNIPSINSSRALFKAIHDTGAQAMHYNEYIHIDGSQVELDAALAALATFDVQAGILADVKWGYEIGIQKHLNEVAQAAGYDNIISACSFAGSTNQFQAEAESFLAWRGNVWTYAFAQVDAVMSGTRTRPTLEELIAELPVRV